MEKCQTKTNFLRYYDKQQWYKNLDGYLQQTDRLKTICPVYVKPLTASQWALDVLWTSNGRLYEVWTSYRRPLHVQRSSDAHWDCLTNIPFSLASMYHCLK